MRDDCHCDDPELSLQLYDITLDFFDSRLGQGDLMDTHPALDG
jgi:hypothetical protein